MQFAFTGHKGHWIYGSGTSTVYHNRNVGTYNGSRRGYMVLTEADAACTVSAKGANSFVINTTGNWEALMVFRTGRES